MPSRNQEIKQAKRSPSRVLGAEVPLFARPFGKMRNQPFQKLFRSSVNEELYRVSR